LHSRLFATDKKYRKNFFSTCPEDRPLVVQFCGNDPEYVVQAALLVQDMCDAVDLNLGCPQRIAKRGNYGAFLMDQPKLVESMVRALHENLKVPIFCKMRVWKDFDKTLKFAKMLENAGCQLLTVHGRTKEMKGPATGLADWEAIKRIKQAMSIPVLSNGNIRHLQDALDCLKATGADGVMSAEGLLRNPALFSGENIDSFQLSREYVDACAVNPAPIAWIKSHLCKILLEVFSARQDLRDKVFGASSIAELQRALQEVEAEVKSGRPLVRKEREHNESDMVDMFDSCCFFTADGES